MEKASILVVEDEMIIANSISTTLDNLGYSGSLIVTSGEEAVKKAEEGSFDLVLMDIILEGEMDGIEAADQIRKRFNIPIVFLTAYSDKKLLERAKKIEPFGYIIKPFEDKELHSVIEIALYKHRVEEALKRSERELSIRNRISKIFLTALDDKIYRDVLQIVLEVMESKYGVFGYVDEHEALVCPSMTRDIWDQCKIPDKDIVFPRGTRGGIWGRALMEKKTLYSNKSFRVPKGHIPVHRALDVPIVHQKKVIGNLLVGNKTTDYNEKDVRLLETIAGYLAPILQARLQRDKEEKDRVKIEEALRASEAFNFALFQYNPLETIVVDHAGKVIKFNKARTGRGGRVPNLGDVMYKDYAAKHEIDMHAELMECIRSGKRKRFPELKYDDRYLSITISPFPMGAIITSQDITERKRAEEEKEKLQTQLIQSEKMAGIGTLAGGISHEFNNLLQIMRGYTEHALKTNKAGDMEEACKIVLSNTDKATKIIRNLLTFSRQKTYKDEFVDTTYLVESVLSIIETQLNKQNIKVERRYERASKIKVNKEEMQQVFLNMVTNARDAMLPKGGKLKIHIRQDKDNVDVSFCDTGKGIEKENLGKVLEPFYTTKGAAGGDSTVAGTGLGLSVSYGIVKKYGGTIEVKSELKKGATFTIKLPVKRTGAEKRIYEDKKKRETKRIPPLDILVMDDEEDICKMFTKFLSSEGHEVKAVRTGKKGINLVRKENFDVVFLDIVMPGIPGAEILDKIKKMSPKAKVVIITGKLMNRDLVNGLRRKGASGFLQKPFRMEDIVDSMARII